MRCSECGHEYAEESGGCQWCGAGVPGEPYREFLPLCGLGGLLTGLVALTTEMIAAQLMLRAYDAASGQPWASSLSSRLGDAGKAAFLLTAIVFVVWFRRARINAENSSWRQRRARGWTFWGWIIPIANLFVPFQLMGDIWRAGLPAARREKTAWLPALWWTAWLLSRIQENGQGWILNSSSQSGGSSGGGNSLLLTAPQPGASSFSLCALAISGALLIPIIRRVSAGAPAAVHGGPAQPRTRRKTSPLVVAALLAAVLGLAGSAAAAVGAIGVSTYHADTVRLRTGNTALVVLSPWSAGSPRGVPRTERPRGGNGLYYSPTAGRIHRFLSVSTTDTEMRITPANEMIAAARKVASRMYSGMRTIAIRNSPALSSASPPRM